MLSILPDSNNSGIKPGPTHAHDLEIMVGTIPPFGGSALFTERTENVRQAFNTWVRHSGEVDAVADFDEALRDPDDPTRLHPEYDSGDAVHPGDAGQQAMADAVDLRWAQGRGNAKPSGQEYVALGGLRAAEPLRGGVEETVTLPLLNELTETTEVTIDLEMPQGWTSEPVTLTLEPGEDVEAELAVSAPSEPSSAVLRAAVDAGPALTIGSPELAVTTVPSPSLSALAIDFGGVGTPVLAGFRGVTPEDSYPSDDLGWVEGAPQWRDRESGDDLRRDVVLSEADQDFRFSIPPGEHTVHLLSGDADSAAGMLVVSEGGTRLAETDGTLEAGEFAWLDMTLDGGDEGRTVDLTFAVEGEGSWRVNALVVME